MAEKRKIVPGQECQKCGCAMWYWKEIPYVTQIVKSDMAYTHEASGVVLSDGAVAECQWCHEKPWREWGHSPNNLKYFYYDNGELAEKQEGVVNG